MQKFGTYGKDVPELSNFQSKNKFGNWYYNSSGTSIPDKQPMPDWVNQNSIYEAWSASLITDKTAKENCDIWMKYNTYNDSQGIVGVPAVTYCRSQNIRGVPCDLPNEYQLICIWACGDKLDEMDPTAKDFSTLKLGYTSTGWLPYGRCQSYNGLQSDRSWSSTNCSLYTVRLVSWDGGCGDSNFKSNTSTVIPILEL